MAKDQEAAGNAPINPQLRDIFRTALGGAVRTDEGMPHIVVHGSGNVFSWGGTVHVTEDSTRRHRQSG